MPHDHKATTAASTTAYRLQRASARNRFRRSLSREGRRDVPDRDPRLCSRCIGRGDRFVSGVSRSSSDARAG